MNFSRVAAAAVVEWIVSITTAIIIRFGVIWQYVVFPISGTFAVAIVVVTIVEAAIYGAIYKPTGVSA